MVYAQRTVVQGAGPHTRRRLFVGVCRGCCYSLVHWLISFSTFADGVSGLGWADAALNMQLRDITGGVHGVCLGDVLGGGALVFGRVDRQQVRLHGMGTWLHRWCYQWCIGCKRS